MGAVACKGRYQFVQQLTQKNRFESLTHSSLELSDLERATVIHFRLKCGSSVAYFFNV